VLYLSQLPPQVPSNCRRSGSSEPSRFVNLCQIPGTSTFYRFYLSIGAPSERTQGYSNAILLAHPSHCSTQLLLGAIQISSWDGFHVTVQRIELAVDYRPCAGMRWCFRLCCILLFWTPCHRFRFWLYSRSCSSTGIRSIIRRRPLEYTNLILCHQAENTSSGTRRQSTRISMLYGRFAIGTTWRVTRVTTLRRR
jgi:hypothetical protein